MKVVCIALLSLCSAAWAQKPTISTVKIDAVDTTSFRVLMTVASPNNSTVWSEVFYGTQSGVYPYNTRSTACYITWPCKTTGGPGSLLVTGLASGTTYYVRVTARPNPDDDKNICNTSDCGSVEQVVTTLSGTQPEAPILPTAWSPAHPDTSAYTVVPLRVGSTGECEAASAVSSPGGWSVRSGDNVWTILREVGYGTVLELPQGIKCLVPPTMPGQNPGTGYILPAKALDSNPACGGLCTMTSPNHRWIVIRTHQASNGDFPPYGARIDPTYAPRLGKFYSAQPNRASQLFSSDVGSLAVHHIWFENVEFEEDPNYTNPPDVIDPIGFQFFAQFGSWYQKQPTEFLVVDRVYAHGPGAPVRQLYGWEFGGNYEAMIGCYTAHVEVSRMTEFPTVNGTVTAGNTVLNVPKSNFRWATSSPELGMTAPATVTVSKIQAAGTLVGNLYKDHLEVQYPSSMGTVTCAGCTAIAVATPATADTAIHLFSAPVAANGQIGSVSWNTQEWETSFRYSMAVGLTFSDLHAPGGPYLFDNNYVDGIGEGLYLDPANSNFANDDVTYTHNHHIWPKNAFAGDPGNEWRYDVRQHFELKRGHRFLIKGNLFSYSWSFQNDDPAIFLSGREGYTAQMLNDGVSDITIQSNTISHGRTGITCQSGNPLGGGDNLEPEPNKRIAITNNVMFDLGSWKYCDWNFCPGLQSNYFENRPGCQDLVITNNTGDVTWGNIPAIFYLGGGGQLSNHLTFQKNILHFSQGGAKRGGGSVGDWPANLVANHDVKPAAVYDVQGVSPQFTRNLEQSFVNTAASVTPHFTWSDNVLIGGFIGESAATAVDITYAQMRTYALNMPPGDIYPAGDTIAARQLAAGLDTHTWRSSIYNPQGIGADIDALNSAMGLVTNIAPPVPSRNSAIFTYTAPDSKACAIDVSTDGAEWVRQMDSGGNRNRIVTVSGLKPVTQYQSRIICYYTQQNDGVLYTDYTPGETTTAKFTTQSQALRQPL